MKYQSWIQKCKIHYLKNKRLVGLCLPNLLLYGEHSLIPYYLKRLLFRMHECMHVSVYSLCVYTFVFHRACSPYFFLPLNELVFFIFCLLLYFYTLLPDGIWAEVHAIQPITSKVAYLSNSNQKSLQGCFHQMTSCAWRLSALSYITGDCLSPDIVEKLADKVEFHKWSFGGKEV